MQRGSACSQADVGQVAECLHLYCSRKQVQPVQSDKVTLLCQRPAGTGDVQQRHGRWGSPRGCMEVGMKALGEPQGPPWNNGVLTQGARSWPEAELGEWVGTRDGGPLPAPPIEPASPGFQRTRDAVV